MTRRRTTNLTAGALAAALVLTGCASGDHTDESPGGAQDHGNHDSHDNTTGEGDGGHDHPADGGPVPEGMAEVTDPLFPVGSEVQLSADHMPGMDGATATIASSTADTVYVVDFEADGMAMTNHKWVTESEIAPSP